MDTKTASAIYDVLVNTCGAREMWRDYFVQSECETKLPSEFRISDELGFGGKFRRDVGDKRWWVDCYPEHKWPDTRLLIEKANHQIEEIRRQWELENSAA